MTSLDSESPGPRLAAYLHPGNRNAARVAAHRPITLRSSSNEPIEAMVENLSRSGFAMSTLADIAIGSVIGLSIGGALRRRVRIVRRVGLAYGCEFLSPLSNLEVNAALRSGNVVEADFIGDGTSAAGIDDFLPFPARNLSYLAKAYILGGLIISLWAVLIFLAWHLF